MKPARGRDAGADLSDDQSMASPLQPMKTFLGKTWGCIVLAALPIALLEGMWSDPEMRKYARMFQGSGALWVAFPIYLLGVFLLWCRWVNRDWSAERKDGGELH